VITVTFDPTSEGAKTAILELLTGDTTGVDLAGTGIAAPQPTNGVNETFTADSGGATPANFTVRRGGPFVAAGGQLRMSTCSGSGACVAPNGNVVTHAFELPESFTFTVDGIATASSSAVDDFSVIFNFKDLNNYYYASFNEQDGTTGDDTNTNGIFRLLNGTRTQLRDFSPTTPPGDGSAALHKIRIEKIRQTIRVFRGNTLMGEVTDGNFTGGQAGLGSLNNAGRFDNFIIRGHHLSEDFTSTANPFTPFLGGTFSISGGKLRLNNANTGTTLPNSNVTVHGTDLPAGDFELFVDGNATSSTASNDDFTIVFNFQNVTNYMFVNFGEANDANTNGIFRVVNSVRTQVGDFGSTLTSPGTARRIRIQKTGTTIRVLRNGSQIGPTVTDGTFTGGRVGVGSRNNAAVFDNVFVETP
jgi:hypothetical protein